MPQPDAEAVAAAPTTGGAAQRLNGLLARIAADADFPALSAQVRRIQLLTDSEHENLHRLADEILQDVGLTQKLLRWVNAAPFVAHRGGVATVSRAISLLGLATVKGIAASLTLLEHWSDAAQAGRLREAFARALLAAHLAGELHGHGPERERVFLAALFQGFGRMLTVRFFPEAAAGIEADAQGDPVRESVAVRRHLGVGYDELALAVARQWGFPDELQRTMERPLGPVPARIPSDRLEWVRWVAAAGTDLADAWLQGVRTNQANAFERCARRYAHLVDKTADQVVKAARQAREHFGKMLKAVDLHDRLVAPLWRAWLAEGQEDPTHPLPMASVLSLAEAAGSAPPEEPPLGSERGTATASAKGPDADGGAALLLAQGLVDVTAALLDDSDAATSLKLVLEILLRALKADRIWLVTPEDSGVAVARDWLGPGAQAVAARYHVALDGQTLEKAELLPALGRLRRDSWLKDIGAAKVQARLPAWYRDACPPRASMIVLPLWRGEQWLGWLHLDGRGVVAPALGGVEWHLIRALRNLAGVAVLQRR